MHVLHTVTSFTHNSNIEMSCRLHDKDIKVLDGTWYLPNAGAFCLLDHTSIDTGC